MRARKPISVLIVSLFLALSLPAPGWGAGGQDIVLDKNSSSSGNAPKHDAAVPRLRGSGRVNASEVRPLRQDPQTSWMTWAWNMLASLYGQFFRTSSDDTRY